MGNFMRLSGKVAIITGAARGQGAFEAERFIAEGASVLLTDLNPAGRAVAERLGSAAAFIQHDVSSEDDWANAVALALSQFGKIDILVNNAGIFVPGSVEETTAASFDQHYRVNQLGVFLGMKAVIPAMKAAGGGSIVNISSAAGMRGYPHMIAYCGSKWAVRGMTQSAARELAPDRIRVNSIHPGLVDTPMLADHTPEALEGFKAAVPLGEMATTEDVARLVVYLASDESSNMTGSALVIDGGLGL
jgi:3alpha(or 20beta)-hydroxysteroid dehydrogenase